MSDEAIMIDKKGNCTRVTSDELRPEDYDNDFLCSGIRKEDGKWCAIPMRPTEGEGVRKVYFYPEKRDRPHIPNCSCSKPRKKITVESLDRRGEGKTSEELYAQIGRQKPNRRNRQKMKGEGAGAGFELVEGYLHVEDNEDKKEIRMKKRMPQDFEELVFLLQSLDTHDTYMNRLVFDWILDERTVEAHRRFGIQLGKPFVVMCRKALPCDYNLTLENDQWLLADYWTVGRNSWRPILFVLNVDAEAKTKLYNLCKINPPAKIGVFAVFHKHPTMNYTYISEPINAQLITAYMDHEPNLKK